MIVSIELPDELAKALETRACDLHSSVRNIALQAIETGLAAAKPPKQSQGRVTFPLVRSAEPGKLRSLTGGEIDELSGW